MDPLAATCLKNGGKKNQSSSAYETLNKLICNSLLLCVMVSLSLSAVFYTVWSAPDYITTALGVTILIETMARIHESVIRRYDRS